MKKVGILGGTFNPIHNAHLMMAQAAYEQYKLDEVWFMPSKNPPHKDKKEIVSEEHRSRMIRLAIDGIKHFSFSDMELTRKGPTYTYDTLAQCVDENPNTKFYFIIGGDSLCDFEKWRKPEKIAMLCSVLATSRGGMSEKELDKRCYDLTKKFKGAFLPVIMPRISISSKEIRRMINKGKEVYGMVPKKVADYIHFYGLYDAKQPKLKKPKEWLPYLEATMSDRRYQHTMGVADTATQLAAVHIGTKEACKQARKAGLLHDCAKDLTPNEMLALCRKYGIALTDVEKENTVLIHGKLGAYFAKHYYHVEDEEIGSAIVCHTTGKPNMTDLEKILYIADFIEPGRKMNCKPYSLMSIRKIAYKNLDKALRMILADTINHLEREEFRIDNMTKKTYEFYKKKGK